MKTAQINDDKIVIKEIENIKLDGRKGAIVKVLGCGLCGSDIVKFRHKISPNGTVLGHEIVGIIEDVDSETQFSKGDKIVSSHHIPCFNCTYCEHGNYSMCEHFKKSNIMPGGFSEKIYLSEEHLKNVAYKVPDNITDEEISFYEPLGCCIRAIKRCNLKEGDKVLVVGLGSIGLIMAEGLKAFGYKVFGCDLIEKRIQLASSKGIESFNSLDIETFNKIIRSKTNNYGVDAVFMTSGADKAIDVALKTVKHGGKILVFSSTPLNNGYANNEIYYKELTVLGSYSPSPDDLKDSFDLITSKKVNVEDLTTIYPLSNIQMAFDDTVLNKIFKAYIKISQV
ncbi:MAG: alcohol dehydrogenase catalytic domain-containing protein [bacterium]|nr:alcohol dehydrogenase catalytic domain-containing protein [bacterium]